MAKALSFYRLSWPASVETAAHPYLLRQPGPAPTPDFDGAWKEALHTWLPGCLALFWPDVHEQIDWSIAPVFLTEELRSLFQAAKKKGIKRVDVLAEVRLRNGAPALLLIHLEVQAGRINAAFAERMFRYRLRLYDKYPEHAIFSGAILLDRDSGTETLTFHHSGLGNELRFRFPVVNLARWRHRVAELEALAPTNPFVVAVLAQLECRATSPDAARLASKLRLAHALNTWNYDATLWPVIFRVIDSLLVLPPALDERFIETLEKTEDPLMMQRLTSLDRVLLRREKAAGMEEGLRQGMQQGMQEGMRQGTQQGVQQGLEQGMQEGSAIVLRALIQRKFGAVPQWAAIRIAEADAQTLQRWAGNVLDADTLEALFEL